MSKLTIGISECLTNSIVRYDGKSQFNASLISALQKHFIVNPICPEIECGLDVPRPAIELVILQGDIQVIGRDDKNINVSQQLIDYSINKVKTLNDLSGYIFKAKSPSCGVLSTPIYTADGRLKEYSNGVFVSVLNNHYPQLPIRDDAMLVNDEQLNDFIQQVLQYGNIN